MDSAIGNMSTVPCFTEQCPFNFKKILLKSYLNGKIGSYIKMNIFVLKI